jgi:hypothetical protein
MQEHEYALLGGVNRARIGRYLTLVAATVSAGIVFIILSAVDLAKRFGLPANLPPAVLSLFGAGAVFTALYWIFDRHAWRWPKLNELLKVPNLAGEWQCEGRTLNGDGAQTYAWTATVTIVQSWDKIRVRLKTQQSGSNSITAALIYDKADGYRLLYNYRNDPKIGETELKSHLGFTELVFSSDLKSADGEYFNGHGRFTFGTMHLVRA